MARIQWPRSLAYRQYGTTRAGWPRRVVSGHGFMDHGAETMLSSMSLVSKEALVVPVLIPVRCLWWPLLLRLWHRFYGREAWCTGNTEPELQGRVAGQSCFRHGFVDHGTEVMLSSKAALPVSVLIVVRCLWWLFPIRLQHRLSDTDWCWCH